MIGNRQKTTSFAFWLLGRIYSNDLKEGYRGDLEEEYLKRLEKGKWNSSFWLYSQVIRSLPGGFKNMLTNNIALISNYIRLAGRNIIKHKVYSFINITGLTVGMACTLLIVLFIKDELSFDSFFEDKDRIFRVIRVMPDIHGPSTRNPLAPALKKDFPEIEYSSRFWLQSREVTISYEDTWFKEDRIAYAGEDFFRIFSFPFIQGDPETSLQEPGSVVLTSSAAKKYFGVDDPLGKVISFDDVFDLKITGIIKDIPSNSHFFFDFIIPVESFNRIGGYLWGFDTKNFRITDQWMWGMFGTYLKLKPNTDLKAFERKIPDFLKKYSPFNKELLDETLYLQAISDIHLYSRYSSEQSRTSSITLIYILTAAGIVILVMAAFNYTNLATAWYFTRTKEVGMRKVIGARRKQLFTQFLGESFIFTLAGIIISVIAVYLLLPAFNIITGKSLFVSGLTDPYVIVIIIFIGIFTALSSGIYPSIFLSGYKPLKAIVSTNPGAPGGSLIRNILVTSQFTVTIFLFISFSLIREQVDYLSSKSLGFDNEQVLIVPVKDDAVRQQIISVKNELLNYPGVTNVSYSDKLPGSIYGSTTIDLMIEGERKVFELNFANVDPDFIDLYGIEIIMGRNFTQNNPTALADEIIINEKTLSILGWEEPIGRKFRGNTIVGIMRDFHFQPLNNEIEPLGFFGSSGSVMNISVKLTTANIPETISRIEEKWNTLVPQRTFEYYFLDESFNRRYRTERNVSTTVGYLSAIAVTLAFLGLFGLASFMISRRTREIGIRKVLGASYTTVLNLTLKDFLVLILAANTLAWPMAFYIIKNLFLSNFPYHIDPGMNSFAFAGILSLLVTLTAVGAQTLKAANANPADSIRYE